MIKKQDISQNASPYEFYGKLPLSKAIPLGLQHVMAMFVGNLTPLIIICGACGIAAEEAAAHMEALKAEKLAEKD